MALCFFFGESLSYDRQPYGDMVKDIGIRYFKGHPIEDISLKSPRLKFPPNKMDKYPGGGNPNHLRWELLVYPFTVGQSRGEISTGF